MKRGDRVRLEPDSPDDCLAVDHKGEEFTVLQIKQTPFGTHVALVENDHWRIHVRVEDLTVIESSSFGSA